MTDIKWKRISSHHGTRVGYEARVNGRIIAQVNQEVITQYNVFHIRGGLQSPRYRTVTEAKRAVEETWAAANKGGDA